MACLQLARTAQAQAVCRALSLDPGGAPFPGPPGRRDNALIVFPPGAAGRVGRSDPNLDQWLVRATPRAISDLMPGTMLPASAFSSRRCGMRSTVAPMATAGMPMLTAIFESQEPTSV